MTGKGSRLKGARYERKIAALIRKALRCKAREVYRTPQSGGHKADAHYSPGDIQVAPRLRKRFPYALECKHHAGAALHPLLRAGCVSPGSYWSKWLAQAVKACPRGFEPCLVTRVSGLDAAVVPAGRCPAAPRISFRCNGRRWSLVRFDDWLKAAVRRA